MKNTTVIYLLLSVGMLLHSYAFSQETAKIIVNDSLKSAIDLQLVTIVSDSNVVETKTIDPTSDQSTDEVLESLNGVSLIRRGNYAAEPTFRGMSSGQLSITVDGMKIFAACTDKMDPVSSYVSSNNLESISVSSNSNHSSQGSNIGGGFDFQTKGPQFSNESLFTGSAGLGYHGNGKGKIADFNLNYGDSAWAINMNANYQKFENYRAGGGEEISYTQFEKINFAISANWMKSSTEILSAQFIYDDAFNIGYPALPMDVSYAGGRIYSLSYKKYLTNGKITFKAYGNNISHVMDDSRRDSVSIRMDMPGQSDTYGIFAKGEFNVGERHQLIINPDYYQNTSFADMTMYPNDPSRPEEPLMYMITWPDVKRHSASLMLSDQFEINDKWALNSSGKLEWVSSKVFSDLGLRQLESLGQDGTIPSTYLLGSADFTVTRSVKKNVELFAQLGYAERQPTVSEGFGYYLYNSMDGFDYIGLPDLKTEKATKATLGGTWSKNKTELGVKVFTYQFQDYIIGIVDSTLDGMTIGSHGVKVYENINSANISGFELSLHTMLFKKLHLQSTAQFSYGTDQDGLALQMIPPFQNTTKLAYTYKTFEFRLESIVAAKQNNPRSEAGETTTPSYGIINLHAQTPFTLWKQEWTASIRLNNILDANYWDHLDWNSVPRPGRSLVLKVNMKF